MVKGLIAQLMNSVSSTGLPLRPAWITEAKSIFTMMGYIMKNRQMAIGNRDDRRAVHVQRHAVQRAGEPGATLPSRMPPRMHSPTHTREVALEQAFHFARLGRLAASAGGDGTMRHGDWRVVKVPTWTEHSRSRYLGP